jgi:hypothetical protein
MSNAGLGEFENAEASAPRSGVSAGTRCSRCGDRIERGHPLEIWDDEDYCVDCVRSVGLAGVADKGVRLVEVVEIPFWRSVARSVWSGLVMTTGGALVIALLFLVVNLLGIAAGKVPNPEALPRRLCLFFLFAWAFTGVVGFPVAMLLAWMWRPRRIELARNELIVSTVTTHRYPLEGSCWQVMRMACDTSGVYFPGSPRLVVGVQIPRDSSPQARHFACGFTEEACRLWKGILILKGVPESKSSAGGYLLRRILVNSTVGGIVGSIIGAIGAQLSQEPMWIVAFGLLGWADGFVIAIAQLVVTFSTVTKRGWIRTRMGKVSFALLCTALGAKVGVTVGSDGMALCALINAFFGAAMTRYMVRAAAPAQRSHDVVDD